MTIENLRNRYFVIRGSFPARGCERVRSTHRRRCTGLLLDGRTELPLDRVPVRPISPYTTTFFFHGSDYLSSGFRKSLRKAPSPRFIKSFSYKHTGTVHVCQVWRAQRFPLL